MPANIGRTLQEQPANTVPDTDATEYASTLLAWGPRCRSTASFDRNVMIAPAMNRAGTTQASVWFRAYHCTILKASTMAPVTSLSDSGRK